MRLRFTKMHGAGNDFIVVDGVRQRVALEAAQWRRLADRHFGIGADQILLVERPGRPDVDFRYRIFNADGNEVEHCGNGARCFVRFVRDEGLATERTVRVETVNGVLELTVLDDGRVTVDMGAPRFALGQVPFDPSGARPRRIGQDEAWELDTPAGPRLLSVLSMGNPHAVQFVDDVESAPVGSEGPMIEGHAAFPRRVNAGFAQVCSPGRLRLRVYERGSGETLACGTGACAAVVAGIRRGLLAAPVDVETRGGLLTIDWRDGGSVRMTGPAERVFTGEIEI